jgi:RNA polymerase sigma-70 factor (ECF subfamily)
MSEAELVRQVIAGQPGARADLARRWAGRVAALCHARVARADVADELALQALRRAFRDLGTLDDAAHFGRWLCGIARDLCLDWLQARHDSPAPRPARNGHALPHGENDLLAGVEALPEMYREVLMLRYTADAGYLEIAEVLDITPATVRARLARARAMLREARAASGDN